MDGTVEVGSEAGARVDQPMGRAFVTTLRSVA
jgi:hypothetical protein